MGQDYSYSQPSSSDEYDITSLIQAEAELYGDEAESNYHIAEPLQYQPQPECDEGIPRICYCGGDMYKLAYYLIDGIYPKWSTFIQSISHPQGPKSELFARMQEATRKDVERAFGVLQARFAIVKNPALSLDKAKIGKIMRACTILHNMIVENERDGYIRYDISEFEDGDVTRSSWVETDRPTNIANMLGIREDVHDKRLHQRLKNDLIENIWNKFGD